MINSDSIFAAGRAAQRPCQGGRPRALGSIQQLETASFQDSVKSWESSDHVELMIGDPRQETLKGLLLPPPPSMVLSCSDIEQAGRHLVINYSSPARLMSNESKCLLLPLLRRVFVAASCRLLIGIGGRQAVKMRGTCARIACDEPRATTARITILLGPRANHRMVRNSGKHETVLFGLAES